MSSSSSKNQRAVAISTEEDELLERNKKMRRTSKGDEEEHRLLSSSSKKSERKIILQDTHDNKNGVRRVSLRVANYLENKPLKRGANHLENKPVKKKIKVLGDNDVYDNNNDAKGPKQQLRVVVKPSSEHVVTDDDPSTQINGAIDSNTMGYQKTNGEKSRLITPQPSSLFLEEQSNTWPPPPKKEIYTNTNFEDNDDDDDDIGLEIDIISAVSNIKKTTFATVVGTETTCDHIPSYPKTSTAKKTKSTGIKFWMRILSLQLLIQFLVGSSFVAWNQASSKLSVTEEDSCIYVSGGGFSGFWFSLGRLRSIPEPESKTFVCYSAGCLGVVATLSNYSMEQLFDEASRIQKRVWDGSLHRYDVVETFVDYILDNSQVLMENSNSNNTSIFSRLQILTSIPDPHFGFHAAIQTPTDISDLKKMLMQTTWIPLAVGSHFSHLGHLDGLFSAFQHPTCKHYVGLAWTNPELMMNILNVNLGPESVERLWDMGLEYGL